MLGFERRVVSALVSSDDPAVRDDIEEFVAGSLRAMPEHLRAGVVAETLLLGGWARLRGAGRAPDAARTRSLIRSFDRSPISLVRQYVRLLRSLVLFAENERTAA